MLSKTLQLRSVFRESPPQQPSPNTFSSRFGLNRRGEALSWTPSTHRLNQHSQSMVTQVKSNPTLLAHRMANVRHRRQDRRPVDSTIPKSRLITWEPL
ncbi:Meckel syndrome type 1 protein-like [Oncorhynchus kisutch]|uniref:Meckel syndrome type 1 protein-like n=1 Tax=Oncorhynchus kisutch TaxID=8019 RepID=UPI0012DC5E1B|nr:Meckel syndrome type 1 protein-like [Oncorhynchus kisutch]